MRSPSGAWPWLFRKEWRGLLASRSWWIMLALTGPLVGMSFISAVNTYAEVSTGAGTGCGAVCDPLTGIWAPTFSAYELIAVFLLPFVAIQFIAADRQSGALTLELQHPMSMRARFLAKTLVLFAGWMACGIAALVAVVLWTSYGGTSAPLEIAVVAMGHVLNAGITVGLAFAAASVAAHPSTAAIATLAVTVGIWIVDFVAAIHGGVWQAAADLTPTAMVARFQHGLVEGPAVLIAVIATLTGLVVAAVWTRLGRTTQRRTLESAVVVAAGAALILVSAAVRGSWDASEGRVNSFSEPEQEALERIAAPLSIEVHMAPVDPRRVQLERSALAKLARVMPHLSVTYTARTSSGLYESADPGYGEIWYALGGKRVMSRMVTDEAVLEAIFGLAGVTPAQEQEPEFRGHPLTAHPTGAAVAFYGAWPALVGLLGFAALRRRTS